MSTPTVTIDARFAGPPRTANGGYTAGLVAGLLTSEPVPVTATLRLPPPLETPLDLDRRDGSAALLDDGRQVAVAEPGRFAHEPVDVVDLAVARAAEQHYRGLVSHPFPGCFVCGTAREPGDGLRLAPGPVGDGLTACVWTPHASLTAAGAGSVLAEMLWAALDCPGGWTSDIDARPMVLGRMTALCEDLPRVGRQYVVVGRLLGIEGRKTFTCTTLYDEGRMIGRAEQTWITVDPATFGG
jgi:hypothetical protein